MDVSADTLQREVNTIRSELPNLAAKELAARYGCYTFRRGDTQYFATDECIFKCEWGNRAHTYIRVVEADCPNEGHEPEERRATSPFERTRRSVYARGNKWQIENLNSTH